MLNEGPPNRASGEIGSGSAGGPRPAERRGDAAKGSSASASFTVTPPKLELPKGGGAVRGMGEKFAANRVTGTGSLNVPIAISPGRSGFAPQLALEYDSGAGNGPFGLGFDLSLPAITRKTEKGLPRYQDTTDSDVFLLSGAEDLVPCIEEVAGVWQPQVAERRLHGETYRVAAYRPRIEGSFMRTERWSHMTDTADVFWRSISRDNVTTWYGKTDESRITDPTDARRIFSWLICESYDDRGNAMSYGYKRESSQGVVATSLHERNRTDLSRGANRYLKRIHYGNRQPHWPNLTAPEATPLPTDWMFEVVFDYGEHDRDMPLPSEEVTAWLARSDPFSSCRAGFELRTYRLCQRVLMFHHFPTELEVGANCLVRSTEFTYAHAADPSNAQHPMLARIASVIQAGHRRDSDGRRRKKTLPPLELEFSAVQLSHRVEEADLASLENLPAGLDGASYQWVDLDGEGLSGILTQQAGALWYKRNLGPLTALDVPEPSSRARFGPAELVAEQPSLLALAGGTQLLDLNGNGNLDAVELDGATPGFFTRAAAGGWEGHGTFPTPGSSLGL